MFKLQTGYLISGFITGCILLFTFLGTIPDGKLHVVFCDVGQGDGVYVQFPDGRSMTIDGGPNDTGMVACLGRHMPFWQRTISLALLTHPQKDHINGLLPVLARYRVDHILRSNVGNTTEGFQTLQTMIKERHINEKLVEAGEEITVGSVQLRVVWPTKQQLASMHTSTVSLGAVLGSSTTGDVNSASVVIKLSYGTFDALFLGDADSQTDNALGKEIPYDPDGLEVLKVPHHGAKTGMTDAFLSQLSVIQGRSIAAISVGKNSYGHPAPEMIQTLEQAGLHVLRTDTEGDIEIISDGKGWEVTREK